MKAKAKLGDKAIGAPSIRIARGEVEIEDRNEEDQNGKVVGRRAGHVTGLRRYLARGEITQRQHDAGLEFALDWDTIRSLAPAAVEPGRVGGGGDAGAAMVFRASEANAADRRFRRAVVALGPCYPCVADVVLAHGVPAAWAERKGYARAAGFPILILGLDALAEFYKLG